MLTLRRVNQYYGGSHILRDVDLDVPAGACTAVLGRNGVGKTTLLKCIVGLLPTRFGTIEFDRRPITRLAPYERAQLGIGYVPQGREIFPRLTVAENLQIGLAASDRRHPALPDFVFDLFPALRAMLRRRGGDLSGGQQQQLAIARALVVRPKLLILDEPTEGIQPSIIKEIGRAIELLSAGGDMAILLVEQYYDFARSLADRYVVMSRGEVIARGDAAAMDAEGVRQLLTV